MTALATWERMAIRRIIRSRSPRSIVGDFVHTAKRDAYGTLSILVPGTVFSVYHDADGTTGRITKRAVRLNQRIYVNRIGAYTIGHRGDRMPV